MGARAWPFGDLCLRSRRLGLRNSLRSDSPRPHIRIRDWGAATPAGALKQSGAMRWRGYDYCQT